MNRFRSRKKSVSEVASKECSQRPSIDDMSAADMPPLPSFTSRTFKRKKSMQSPEPRRQIDLATALPTTDDFRTSLLMPKLSARFSMLREQDDPSSKLGKASDDSVLFPRRASRLDLFNSRSSPLNDIAEVSSIRASSIRPPFASKSRAGSYHSVPNSPDTMTDETSSIITRARPNEGNIMFGGRQKVYKISTAPDGDDSHSITTIGGGMSGKHVYQSDVTTSTFQQLREQEKRERELAAQDFDQTHSTEDDRSGSPPSAHYNKNRETSSSTNSGPSQSRASTAATSVASQRSIYGTHENFSLPSHASPVKPSEKSFVKNRRLYGHGFERDVSDQHQASSLTRLESIGRARTPVSTSGTNNVQAALRSSRSTSHLGDRYARSTGGTQQSPASLRGESPASTRDQLRRIDSNSQASGNEDQSNAGLSRAGQGRQSPLSPSINSDLDPAIPDPTLLAATEPNDVGKATAAGVFNRPQKQYDEQQWLQRQMQLQEERSSPTLHHAGRSLSPLQDDFVPNNAPPLTRDNILEGGITRTISGPVRSPWTEDRVPRVAPESHSSANLVRHEPLHNEERSFLHGVNSPDLSVSGSVAASSPCSPSAAPQHYEPLNKSADNFFQGPSGSASSLGTGADSTSDTHSSRTVTLHSASPPSGQIPTKRPRTPDYDHRAPVFTALTQQADSPTLPSDTHSEGLSGLVHTHLRHKSDQSSIYPEDSPHRRSTRRSSTFRSKLDQRESIFGHGSALDYQDTVTGSNDPAFDDDQRTSIYEEEIPPVPPLSIVAHNILAQAQALRMNQLQYPTNGRDESGTMKNETSTRKAQQILGEVGESKAQRVLGGEAPRQHVRTISKASVETQMEREDLANELANRRRQVQDRLAITLEDRQPMGALPPATNPISSKSLEKPTKALKMLGLNSASQHKLRTFPAAETGDREIKITSGGSSVYPAPGASPVMVDALGLNYGNAKHTVPQQHALPFRTQSHATANKDQWTDEAHSQHHRDISHASSRYSDHTPVSPLEPSPPAVKSYGAPKTARNEFNHPSSPNRPHDAYAQGPIGVACGTPPVYQDSQNYHQSSSQVSPITPSTSARRFDQVSPLSLMGQELPQAGPGPLRRGAQTPALNTFQSPGSVPASSAPSPVRRGAQFPPLNTSRHIGSTPSSAVSSPNKTRPPQPASPSISNGDNRTTRPMQTRSRSNSKASSTFTADPRQPPRIAPPGTPFMIGPSKTWQGHGAEGGAPNSAPSSASSAATMTSDFSTSRGSPSMSSTPITTSPSRGLQNHQNIKTVNRSISAPRPHHSRKTPINKADISEPTFISSTYTVNVVPLPAGASLKNGMPSASSAANSQRASSTSNATQHGGSSIFPMNRQGRKKKLASPISPPIPTLVSPAAVNEQNPLDTDTLAPSHSLPSPHQGNGPMSPLQTVSPQHTPVQVSEGASFYNPISPLSPHSSGQSGRKLNNVASDVIVEDKERISGQDQNLQNGHLEWTQKKDVPASAVMF